jgi:catechol 2,3-dioxygenase-like lactoylglutathione lyase family enzyme
MYIRLEDVAAEIAALAQAGIPLARGPEDAFYPMREIEVLDPDGYRICLAQPIG